LYMFLTVLSVHIYFGQSDEEEVKFANELWERIRRECEGGIDTPYFYSC
jgi:hypothetical protein